jgi:hypothetical protein
MQKKYFTMRINQLVSDYLTLSREKGWTMVEVQPTLAIKHLLSVVKPAQLKEVCENDLLATGPNCAANGLLWLFEASQEDCRRRCSWEVSLRAGKDTKSIDRVSTGGSTKSYTSGFSSGFRRSTAKASTSSPSKSNIKVS